MVNWDEKCLSCQQLATCRHKIRCLAIQKPIYHVSGVCWCTVLLKGVKVKLSPQVCESDHFGHFCGYNVKTSAGLGSTSCIKPVCTRSTLWLQHYFTTSKEYLISSHILFQYFELVFLQLHLVEISYKLIIIWLNYEREKKGAFYETPCATTTTRGRWKWLIYELWKREKGCLFYEMPCTTTTTRGR